VAVGGDGTVRVNVCVAGRIGKVAVILAATREGDRTAVKVLAADTVMEAAIVCDRE
jgi:hypothetical protein